MAQYLDNKKFLEDIRNHFATKEVQEYLKNKELPRPVIPDHIAKNLILIAQNYSKSACWNFIRYKEDLVDEAIVACVRAYYSYDPDRGTSPLSYFTTTCYRAFLGIISSEKKQETVVATQIDEIYHGFVTDCLNPNTDIKITQEAAKNLMKFKENLADFREKNKK